MSDMEYPQDLLYTDKHEWLRESGDGETGPGSHQSSSVEGRLRSVELGQRIERHSHDEESPS